MKRTFLLPAFFAALLLASCSGGDSSTSTSDSTSTTNTTTMSSDTGSTATTGATTPAMSTTPLEAADQEFVKKAAMGGMMEVQAGQLAQSNGMHDRVKNFAAMMVRDHQQANQELMSLAQTKGLMLSDSMDKKTMDHMAEMQKMQGKAFDKHYMGMMVHDHASTISDFENASKNAKDADLKAWAAKMLPALKMHKDSADAINKAVK